MGNDSEKIVKKIANRAQNDCNDVKIEEHVNKKTKFGWIIATP